MDPGTERFRLQRGHMPLLISFPHVGTGLPAAIAARMTDAARALPDTDWHVDEVYDFAQGLGCSLLKPVYSRYVVDLNRPPDGANLYAAANNTGLCPAKTFEGLPIYRAGGEPTEQEVAERRRHYWEPYHAALAQELARIKDESGYALLLDAHSIRSQLPWLFEGTLPNLNLGTAEGRSCSASLRQLAAASLGSDPAYSRVLDGRFKGGHITRHYGRPAERVHAIQLEVTISCYADEQAPFAVDPSRAAQFRRLLERFIRDLLAWRPDHA